MICRSLKKIGRGLRGIPCSSPLAFFDNLSRSKTVVILFFCYDMKLYWFIVLFASMKQQCICNICTCSRHTCFGEKHIQEIKELEQRQNMKKRQNNFRYENISSTYKQHYQPWKRVRTDHTQFGNVGRQTLENNHSFTEKTSYQMSYNQKYDPKIVDTLNPEINLPQPSYIRPTTKFQGQSTYKSIYKDSPYMDKIRMINSQKTNRNRQSFLKYPFQGSTTYNNSYQPYFIQIKPQIIRSNVEQTPYIKFDGSSIYKDHYKSYTIKEQLNDRCPVQMLPIPPAIYSQNKKHIYYDSLRKAFI